MRKDIIDNTMVNSHTYIDFGSDDISIQCIQSDGRGLLMLSNTPPGMSQYSNPCKLPAYEVGRAPAIMSFSSKASIDAFITALNTIRPYVDD